MKSNCCQAPMIVGGDDDGLSMTHYYYCEKCNFACDAMPNKVSDCCNAGYAPMVGTGGRNGPCLWICRECGHMCTLRLTNDWLDGEEFAALLYQCQCEDEECEIVRAIDDLVQEIRKHVKEIRDESND